MKSIYWPGITQQNDGFFSHCSGWERWDTAHFKLGNTSWIPFILYANKTAPALLTDEERLTKCPKSWSIKKTLIFSTFPTILGWGQIFPKFSILSLSITHHAHTPPSQQSTLHPHLEGGDFYLWYGFHISFHILASAPGNLCPIGIEHLSLQVDKLRYLFPVHAAVLTHISTYELLIRVLEKMLILARAHSQPMRSELLGLDVSISTFLNFQVIPRCC